MPAKETRWLFLRKSKSITEQLVSATRNLSKSAGFAPFVFQVHTVAVLFLFRLYRLCLFDSFLCVQSDVLHLPNNIQIHDWRQKAETRRSDNVGTISFVQQFGKESSAGCRKQWKELNDDIDQFLLSTQADSRDRFFHL